MGHIAVIGGGLCGLTVGLRLARSHRVTLLEAGPRPGGQIWTERSDGFVIERGAEGFVARSEALPLLAAELGMGDELIGQATTTSYGFDGGLSRLEPGEAARLLGFQVSRDDRGRGIKTFLRGMGSLVEALAERVAARTDLRLGEQVSALSVTPSGVRLHTAGGALAADAAVLATSAAAAGALISGDASGLLASAPTMSSVTVELAYPRAAIAHPLDGTGFVVATAQQEHGLRACTFTSSKFPARAPEDRVSLRLFFRPGADDLAELDDAAWQARAEHALRRILAVRGAPLRSWVTRWPRALPVFSEAHRAAVVEVERALEGGPIVLAGSAFHGSGIDAAVRSADIAVERLRSV